MDLIIAATAIAAELPLYTTHPGGFASLDHLVTVIPVARPELQANANPTDEDDAVLTVPGPENKELSAACCRITLVNQ